MEIYSLCCWKDAMQLNFWETAEHTSYNFLISSNIKEAYLLNDNDFERNILCVAWHHLMLLFKNL
jgi:hypothetical protein